MILILNADLRNHFELEIEQFSGTVQYLPVLLDTETGFFAHQ